MMDYSLLLVIESIPDDTGFERKTSAKRVNTKRSRDIDHKEEEIKFHIYPESSFDKESA